MSRWKLKIDLRKEFKKQGTVKNIKKIIKKILSEIERVKLKEEISPSYSQCLRDTIQEFEDLLLIGDNTDKDVFANNFDDALEGLYDLADIDRVMFIDTK